MKFNLSIYKLYVCIPTYNVIITELFDSTSDSTNIILYFSFI